MPWTNPLPITTFTVPTGATTGARVVLDGTTGLISVYNTGGSLVGTWGGPNGCLISYSVSGNNAVAELCGGFLLFFNSASPSTANASIDGGNVGVANILTMNSGKTSGQPVDCLMTLQSGDVLGNEIAIASQRGVEGGVLSTDVISPGTANNLRHADFYPFTTNGSGDTTITHGAAFTPKGAMITVCNPEFTVNAATCFVWYDGITSTTVAARFLAPGGGPFVGTGRCFMEVWA